MTTKLIRDRVLERPWTIEAAKQAVRAAYDEAEFNSLLRRKLLEEVGEYLEAGDLDEAIDEAADILEVICEGLRRRGIQAPAHAVFTQQQAKRRERGGFERSLVLSLTPAVTGAFPADQSRTSTTGSTDDERPRR